MARSLRELIEFLLAEISLCGERGASPADVLAFIDSFYASATQQSDQPNHEAVYRAPNVDHKFKQNVWVWLTRHPEVSVGKNREGNNLTLDEVEAQYTQNSAREPSLDASTAQQPEEDVLAGPEHSSSVPETQTKLQSGGPFRVFVSEERMWFAIAGHERDHSRIMPLEFALLSLIASRKGQGIMQPELPGLSGQDKRSVPKRTDALSRKGYIEKRAVQYKSARTSLCTLRRFVRSRSSGEIDGTTGENTGPSSVATELDSVIDFPVLVDKLFRCLKEYNVITRNDLKAKLGMEDRWQGKVLGRAVRKLERIGCVRRVRAVSQYSDMMKTRHPSIMLLREPTEIDYRLFIEDSRSLVSYLEQENTDTVEVDQDQDAGDEPIEIKRDVASPPEVEYLEHIGRIVPRWAPDQILTNLIHDIVDKNGREGSTNQNINVACMGAFYRRPVEALIGRLVDSWRSSHPLQPQHPAIVRDVALRGTVSVYIHYSLRHFSALVNEGLVSWEAVKLSKEKRAAITAPPVDIDLQVDGYGFLLDKKPSNLLNDGDASLKSCLEAAKPTDYLLTTFDPVAVRCSDNSTVFRAERVYKDSSRDSDRFNLEVGQGEKEAPDSPFASGRKRRGSVADPDQPSNILLGIYEEAEALRPAKRGRKAKDDVDRYAGMTEKEKLEAQGFDESWTEYSILLLERPGPGIFFTPKGRRQPVGKARGRPPKSRIAVVKSERLKELDWFVDQGQNEVALNEGTEDAAGGFAAVDNTVPSSDRLASPDHEETEKAHPTMEPASQLTEPVHPAEAIEASSPIDDQTRESVGSQVSPSKKRKFAETGEDGDEESLAVGTPEPHPKRRGRKPKKRKYVTRTKSSVKKKGRYSNRGVEDKATAETTLRNSPTPPLDGNQEQGSQQTAAAQVTPRITRRGAARKAKGIGMGSEQQLEPAQSAETIFGPNDTAKASEPLSSDKATSSTFSQPAPQTRSESVQPVHSISGSAIPTATTELPEGDRDGLSNDQKAQDEVQNTGSTRENVCNGIQAAAGADVDATNALLENGDVENKTAPSQTTDIVDIDSRASEPGSATKGKSNYKKQEAQGGSIALLRRKIVTDIVESAGGLYPFGTEIWYPFTTAWLKSKQTGRPDFRTLRTTVKYMTDSGKLRQLTFSGRNSKGLMVTKSIIAKPEIDATDPRVLNMQKAMLDADPQQYLPPGPDIDPSVRKSHKSYRFTNLPTKRPHEFEEEVVVTLHQLPAVARPPENRPPRIEKPRSQPRERLRSTKHRYSPFSLNYLTSSPSGQAPEVRLPETSEYVSGQAIVAGDSIRDSSFRVPRRHLPIPKVRPPASIFRTPQSFHAPTGTFGTGIADTLRRGSAIIKPRHMVTALPRNLKDILQMIRRRHVDTSSLLDPVSSRFFSEVDAVGKWEFRHPELFDLEKDGWRYINHIIPGPFESASLEGPLTFEPSETMKAPAGRVTKPPRTPFRNYASSPARITQRSRPSDRLVAVRGQTLPETPVNRRLEKFQELKEKQVRATVPGARRKKLIKILSADIIRKVTVAVVVVKALAGGLEGKLIDWELVTLGFPNHDPKFIRDIGKAILPKYRLQMQKMQSDFQDRFAEAYERDQVPPIDYNDLTLYDWPWIVEWANHQLEGPRSDSLPSLPATRQQFNSLFDLRPEPVQNLDELYQHNAPATIPRKQALLANTNFVIPLSRNGRKRERQLSGIERLNIAKTWVRANVITPEELYNPVEARRVLEYLGEELIGQAIQSLIIERVISMGNRGRVTPGRNYDVTEYFVHTFGRKRATEASHLKRAVTFKTEILDTQLHLEGKCPVSYEAEDGDMIVLINLLAEGRIRVWPVNPPKDKYGLTEGGYLTRLMDKGKLRFDIEVFPVPERYIYGNPVTLPQMIPRGDLPPDFPPSTGSPPLCKIPLWFDVHGNFVKMLWDLVVGGVVGYIAARPGLSTADISRIFEPHISEWEVTLALEWMQEAGVVERLGSAGWAVKEWWWMVVQG
ncbi:hypothetical protein AJ79_05437 [Helicocarpus griseus UAMH5409]|uniref:Uncharacterized protein n=1 Tax=Helicocarpus griseus UAMH5409 TaxID=1447875 RepID=A0A2B7XNG0_9EURO|nr:hypothetical protein AJ79_05437 [Helicocarpus griseus UAMH5409]